MAKLTLNRGPVKHRSFKRPPVSHGGPTPDSQLENALKNIMGTFLEQRNSTPTIKSINSPLSLPKQSTNVNTIKTPISVQPYVSNDEAYSAIRNSVFPQYSKATSSNLEIHSDNIAHIADGRIHFKDQEKARDMAMLKHVHGNNLHYDGGGMRFKEGYDHQGAMDEYIKKSKYRVTDPAKAHDMALKDDYKNSKEAFERKLQRQKEPLVQEMMQHPEYRHLGEDTVRNHVMSSAPDAKGNFTQDAHKRLQDSYNAKFSAGDKVTHQQIYREEQEAKRLEEEGRRAALEMRQKNLKNIHGDNVSFSGDSSSYKDGYDHQKVSEQYHNRKQAGYDQRSVDDSLLDEAWQEHRERAGYGGKSPSDVSREAHDINNEMRRKASGYDQREVDDSLLKEARLEDKAFAKEQRKKGTPKSLNEQWNALYTSTHSDNVAAQGAKKNAAGHGQINALDQLIKEDGSPEEIEQAVKSIGSRFGKRGDKLDEFVDKHIQNGNVDIAGLHNINNKHVYNINPWDKAVGNKVPQMAAGTLGLAWMVSNMASAKGQQTNGQLYGQQTPYY